MKVYVVFWDNGELYEDHAQGILCICKTEKHAIEMVNDLRKTRDNILKIENRGDRRDHENMFIEKHNIYALILNDVKFFMRAYNLDE